MSTSPKWRSRSHPWPSEWQCYLNAARASVRETLGLGLVWVWVWFGLVDWFGLGLGLVWFGFGFGLVWLIGLVWVWVWFGLALGLVWFGLALGLVWVGWLGSNVERGFGGMVWWFFSFEWLAGLS